MSRKKISIIGSGTVGATAAYMLAEKNICDIVLVDIIDGIPQGRALDIQETGPIQGFDTKLSGYTNDFTNTKNSDIVVITAGVPRNPNIKTRDELLEINVKVMKTFVHEIKKYSPNAIIIVVTNPLDAIVYAVKKLSGYNKQKIIGMAGVLDSARFRAFISMETGFSCKSINAMVLGGHGDDMVPLTRYANINGIPITEFLTNDQIEKIVKRTRNGGKEIVDLLKISSTQYAPAASLVEMIEAIVLDKKSIVPVAAYLEGEYNYHDLFIGVPVVLGQNGIEKVIQVKLTADEKKALDESAERVKGLKDTVDKILEHLK